MDNKEEIILLMKKECGECASHDGLDAKNLVVLCDEEQCECLIAINKFKANSN
jgi:hypothetical protein